MDAPEQMAAGIYRIDGMGLPAVMNVLVAQGQDGWTLVDTGTSGSPKRIQSALASLGVGSGPRQGLGTEAARTRLQNRGLRSWAGPP